MSMTLVVTPDGRRARERDWASMPTAAPRCADREAARRVAGRGGGAVPGVRVADADPDLFEGLDPVALERARRAALADVQKMKPGSCDLNGDSIGRPQFGLLILEGVLVRRVEIAGGSCGELVGPGDVLRPWLDCTDASAVPTLAVWRALVPTSVAVLDAGFARAVRLWPEVPAALMDRLLLRARWLELQITVCQRKPVAERLHVMLWQFAYRWGTVTPEGVALSLPLTHQLLADVVGAERPTVTTALGGLIKEGLIKKTERSRHQWTLLGEPPSMPVTKKEDHAHDA